MLLNEFKDPEGSDITLSFTYNGADPLPAWALPKTQGSDQLIEFWPSADQTGNHVINVKVQADTGESMTIDLSIVVLPLCFNGCDECFTSDSNGCSACEIGFFLHNN